MVECISIFFFAIKLLLCLAILALTLVICCRIWLEPFKGKCKCKVKLDGKVALVTGGLSGIGLETAKDLARRGATVVIGDLNEKTSNEVVSKIIAETGNPNVRYIFLDLSKFSSTKKFVENFNKNYDRLDILVNNAGCAGLKQAYTEDGIEKIMQINYFGPFLLTHLLMDKLEAAKPSRIVIVGSKAHVFHKLDLEDLTGNRALDRWSRYSTSKLCDILWAKALKKHLPEGITANSLHPGLVKTSIFDKYSGWRKTITHLAVGAFFKTPEEGAQTSIHLCVAPELEGVSGEYFRDCNIDKPDKIAQDNAVIDAVWDKTMVIIKERAL